MGENDWCIMLTLRCGESSVDREMEGGEREKQESGLTVTSTEHVRHECISTLHLHINTWQSGHTIIQPFTLERL